jgi:hypothetical protein
MSFRAMTYIRNSRFGCPGSPLPGAVHVVFGIRHDRRQELPIWFAAEKTRPLLSFADLWTTWTSVRKAREGKVTDIFGFLTCEPNAEVAKVHPRAMPVILTAAAVDDVLNSIGDGCPQCLED